MIRTQLCMVVALMCLALQGCYVHASRGPRYGYVHRDNGYHGGHRGRGERRGGGNNGRGNGHGGGRGHGGGHGNGNGNGGGRGRH